MDSDLILGMFSENSKTAVKRFIEYNEDASEEECLEDNWKTRLTDEEARMEINKILPINEAVHIKSMPKVQRDEIIRQIKAIEGISQRQAARILGVAPNLVLRA